MEPISSTAYDGKPRLLWSKPCEVCQRPFWVPRHRLRSQRTCSPDCRGKLRRQRVSLTCATCNKPFERAPNKLNVSRSGVYFCCRKCKDEGQRIGGVAAIQPPHYGTGAPWVARYIRIRGRKCEECGRSRWSEQPIPLELHHVDGNSRNHADNNLQLLCPNCHALTPNYRGRNKNHGVIVQGQDTSPAS